MHIGKAGTDVLLIGKAWAPDKRPVQRMQVGMKVADRQKLILVTGDRVWQDGVPSRATAVRVDAPHLGACVRRRASRRRQGRGRGAQPGGMWIRRRTFTLGACRDFPSRTSRIPRPRCSRSAVAAAGMSGADRSVVAAAPRVRRDLRRAVAAQRGRRICPMTSTRASFSARRRSSRSIAICSPASTSRSSACCRMVRSLSPCRSRI